jgi:hypothetical protein
MLFTDSDIVTSTDLQGYDGECARVASSAQPQIILTGPGSIINRTVTECGHKILQKFQNFSGYLVSPGINLNQVAAVLNILSTAINRPRMRLNQVVAIDPDPTKRLVKDWIAYSSLYLFYRDAYARFAKAEDRYARKMDMYKQEANAAWDRLTADGIPVVLQPLACPGATREFGAGTFSGSNVTAGGSGSTETGNAYSVSITWTASGFVNPLNNMSAESAGSIAAAIKPTSGQVVTVTTTGLNPPNGNMPPNIGVADGLYTPLAASGWNVYVSGDQQNWYLQNSTPIAIATTSYTLSNAPVLSGYTLGLGQPSIYNFSFQNMLQRA